MVKRKRMRKRVYKSSLMGTLPREAKNYRIKIEPSGGGYWNVVAIPSPSGRVLTFVSRLFPKTEATKEAQFIRKKIGHRAPFSYNELYKFAK